jgi:hypothetical protein
MIWRRIPKENSRQPATGSYEDWKELLAEEGAFQCVYCAINESRLGGTRIFHVEHYRPKSKFPELANIFVNLFYACPICNTFKGDDWPSEPVEDHAVVAYPDPGRVDYNDVVSIDKNTGLVEGRNSAGRYVVERLYLNRPQLILERRIDELCARLDVNLMDLKVYVSALRGLGSRDATEQLAKLSFALLDLLSLRNRLADLRPYKPNDVRRSM